MEEQRLLEQLRRERLGNGFGRSRCLLNCESSSGVWRISLYQLGMCDATCIGPKQVYARYVEGLLETLSSQLYCHALGLGIGR
jgi:hypothetical protein